MTEDLNPFALAQHKLDEAAAILNLDDATHQMLRFGSLDVCAQGVRDACSSREVTEHAKYERVLITAYHVFESQVLGLDHSPLQGPQS